MGWSCFGGNRNEECPQAWPISFSLSSPLFLLSSFKVGESIGESIGESPTFWREHITKIRNMTGSFHEVGILWYITDIMLNRQCIVVGLNELTSWHWSQCAGLSYLYQLMRGNYFDGNAV